ncbi:MAG: hypothetical protein AAGB22_08905 [Bacteroidota bacterium]
MGPAARKQHSHTTRMEQQDYLQRQIEQLGRVLGKILANLAGLKNQGNVSEGLAIAAEALNSELDIDLDALAAVPTDALVKTLTEQHNIHQQHLDKIADLFFEFAEGFYQEGAHQKAVNLYEKTMALYRHLDETGAAYSFDRHFKAEKINNVLKTGL